jgi:hypothetical protein
MYKVCTALFAKGCPNGSRNFCFADFVGLREGNATGLYDKIFDNAINVAVARTKVGTVPVTEWLLA